jgi:hypothetical protein
MEEDDYLHTEAQYETSDVDVLEFVPDGFTHDETLEFSKVVNYVFEDDNGNVFRMSVQKDTLLFKVAFYANNKEKGHSNSFPARDESELSDVRDRVLSRVDLN